MAAGATFVARTTTYHVQQVTEMIQKAILHEGFRVVEILSQCPTYFGRKNRLGDAVDMMERYKEHHGADRLQGEGGESGSDRAGHFRAEGSCRNTATSTTRSLRRAMKG